MATNTSFIALEQAVVQSKFPQMRLQLIVLLLSFALPFVSACGGDFTNTYGFVTSPNYPSKKEPPNLNCSWNISTPVGTKIVLQFLQLKLNGDNDCIQVTDLSSKKKLNISNQRPVENGRIFSESNSINILFVTDKDESKRFFKLVWKVKSDLTWNSNFVTWPAARAICIKNRSMLITDVNDNRKEINEKMQEHHVTEIWQRKYITPWVWLKGCFQFENLDGFQTVVQLKKNQMTECLTHCRKWNFFGLKENNCFCFDTFAGKSIVTEPNCVLSCPGNSRERCGGNNSLTIYMNDICYINSTEWKGNVSRTMEGNICLPWRDVTTVANDTTVVFPDGSADEASNYCRNPNGSKALWCYVSQNKTEFCDVPPCIKYEADLFYRCMTVKKNDNSLDFFIRKCDGRKYQAICSGEDQPHYVMNSKDNWETQRYKIQKNNSNAMCKSLADSSVFFMDTNRLPNGSDFYWIGFVRDYTTSRATDVGGKLGGCFTASRNSDKVKAGKVTDCQEKRHFICETVPVTCGEAFDGKTNGSLQTPNYPEAYDALVHCIWTVFVPDDHYIMLAINTYMEDSPSCQYDFLKIYEGSSIQNVHFDTLCGNATHSFDNIKTNITLEFLSDETLQSSGIFVAWSFVPIIQTTTTLVPSTELHEDGALAGIIVGIVLLLVLACFGGFVFGRRRRLPRDSKNRNATADDRNGEESTGGNALNRASMKNKNIASETSFRNAGYKADVTNDVSPIGGEPSNITPAKRVGNGGREPDDAGAVYSEVNKLRKDEGAKQKKLAQLTEMDDNWMENKPEEVYNILNEKAKNVYAIQTENIYNHFNDSESNYDCTTSPREIYKGQTVAPDFDTYDHQK